MKTLQLSLNKVVISFCFISMSFLDTFGSDGPQSVSPKGVKLDPRDIKGHEGHHEPKRIPLSKMSEEGKLLRKDYYARRNQYFSPLENPLRDLDPGEAMVSEVASSSDLQKLEKRKEVLKNSLSPEEWIAAGLEE
jgi:hypothetical protein